MEPQIRFCTTPDGVSIACAIIGKGPPLLYVAAWGNNAELEWQHPTARRFFEIIGQHRQWIEFHNRGIGLTKGVTRNPSLETLVADIALVADQLELEQFDYWGSVIGTAAGVVYAARYPERVSRLVLWGAYSHGSQITSLDALSGLTALIRSNWSLARRAITDIGFPGDAADERRWYSNMLRQNVSPEAMVQYLELQISIDIRPYLPKVKAPTLVLHRFDDRAMPIDAARDVAAAIPNARFVGLKGDITHPYFGDISYLETVIEFLNEGRRGKAITDSRERPTAAQRIETDPMVGKTISHYKIIEKLGEGGMGVVYKAEDTKLDRPVALKFLSPQAVGAEEDKIRFVREAKAAAALSHPNICTVYEIDDIGNQTFISMEFIDGQGLDEKIASGPLDVNQAVALTIQIAEGLRRAHRRGIVHRDIKSANILIDEDGQAKILDFGLAKLTEQSRLTKTATIMGTVSYMSPEQARGEETIDYRTDIWSLGVVLYEMLAGKLPFKSTTDAGLIYRIIHEDPEPIERFRNDIPEALAKALKKTMQKDLAERYADMEALISDLKSIRSGAAPRIEVRERTVPSIAVLPFVDMSAGKDQEYFCDGISESIINELTQVSDLRVIARTSAFSFKGQNLDVREIGRKLNVATVLEGSIQKAGDRVRVTAQLVNTARGEHLWSEKFDRDMEDIFAIQDEISEAIVSELKPRLLLEEKEKLAKRQTVDMAAYNLYLKGRWFWNKSTEEDLLKAIECFEQAIEKCPDYALAYSGLADAYIALPYYSSFPSYDVNPKAKEAALKALEIDPELAEAHTSLGRIMNNNWDWERAEEEFRKAIQLNPGYATGHMQYSIHLLWMTRFDEAMSEMRRALELDPLSLSINSNLGVVLHYAGDHDQAIEVLKKTAEMDPYFGYVHIMLGFSYLGKSMHKEALEEFQKERELSKMWDLPKATYIGVAYALLGKKEEARKTLDELLKRSEKEYIPPWFVAYLHFALREDDKGFWWLEKAYEACDHWLCWLRVHPIFRRLQSDPRYVAMLGKIGLAEPDATLSIIEPSPSIAVLPFVNMSADPEQEYFCDGMAEELINALTQIKDLKVIARTSAFSFKGKNVNVRDIGRELGVGNILEGSVRKAGNRIRITAQLVDTSSGHHLWSEKYDREMKDIFAIQDEITEAIVNRLKPKLLPGEKARPATKRTANPEAYDLYLRGKYFFQKFTEKDSRKAYECFEKAVEKDPDSALAYCGLAMYYFNLQFVSSVRPKEVYPKATEWAVKALEIDDTLCEAHWILGWIKSVYEWDWAGGERELKQALELSPNDSDAHQEYAQVLAFVGRLEEALELAKRAVVLDPFNPFANYQLIEVLNYMAKHEEATQHLQKSLEIFPDFGPLGVDLGITYLLQCRYEEALKEFKALNALYLGSAISFNSDRLIGATYALMGETEKAKRVLVELEERSRETYVPPTFIAGLYFVLGDHDKGYEWLGRAYEEHDYWLSELKVDPGVDMLNLRSDPRYQAMLKKINLAD